MHSPICSFEFFCCALNLQSHHEKECVFVHLPCTYSCNVIGHAQKTVCLSVCLIVSLASPPFDNLISPFFVLCANVIDNGELLFWEVKDGEFYLHFYLLTLLLINKQPTVDVIADLEPILANWRLIAN